MREYCRLYLFLCIEIGNSRIPLGAATAFETDMKQFSCADQRRNLRKLRDNRVIRVQLLMRECVVIAECIRGEEAVIAARQGKHIQPGGGGFGLSGIAPRHRFPVLPFLRKLLVCGQQCYRTQHLLPLFKAQTGPDHPAQDLLVDCIHWQVIQQRLRLRQLSPRRP